MESSSPKALYSGRPVHLATPRVGRMCSRRALAAARATSDATCERPLRLLALSFVFSSDTRIAVANAATDDTLRVTLGEH